MYWVILKIPKITTVFYIDKERGGAYTDLGYAQNNEITHYWRKSTSS